MLQAILDKYINTEVSNSLKIHTNSEMRECIIETFKLIVEQIKQLIEDNEDELNSESEYYPLCRIEEIIEEYYNQQINK